MLRAIAIGAVLGAEFAGAAVCALMPPPTKLAAAEEAWPVCGKISAVTDSSDWAQLDPDFAAGKKALAAGDWNGANSRSAAPAGLQFRR
jgi:hypothetical protein